MGEDNVKLSWAPWPCPKKGPWPAPPVCGEGGVELEDLVNQSADVQKEDNVTEFFASVALDQAVCVTYVPPWPSSVLHFKRRSMTLSMSTEELVCLPSFSTVQTLWVGGTAVSAIAQ